ncbi:unnamed protein product [Paramecium sonneborni]|uniref:Transmembrane protein n=1 Tax=Paramecium sonneborni TaxID=65129 RepID=A0A8S1K357_9CILI|nr:unnamed protein product [Paramecium sonneborni]
MIFSIINIRLIILRTPMKTLSQNMRFWLIWFWYNFRFSFLLLLLIFDFFRGIKIAQIDFLQFIFGCHIFKKLIEFIEEKLFQFFIINQYFRFFFDIDMISFMFLNK